MVYAISDKKFQKVGEAVQVKTGLRFSPVSPQPSVRAGEGGNAVKASGATPALSPASFRHEWVCVDSGVRYTMRDKAGYYFTFQIRFDPRLDCCPDFEVDIGKHLSVDDTARQIVGFVGAFLMPCGVAPPVWGDQPSRVDGRKAIVPPAQAIEEQERRSKKG